MTNQTPSEPNDQSTSPVQENEISLENLQEQCLNLKLEIEQLHRNVEMLRKWLQTLVTGLIVAIVVAIGIVSWFAYRLLIQQKLAQLEAEKTANTKTELLGRIEQLEGQIKRQTEQVEELRQQLPVNLSELIRDNQKQLQQLRDQLQQIEIESNQQPTQQQPTQQQPTQQQPTQQQPTP